MKPIEFIDALNQIDPALIEMHLKQTVDETAADQPAAQKHAGGRSDAESPVFSPIRQENPRRLKLLSAAGIFGSIAACAMLVCGIWFITRPDLSATEQSSQISEVELVSETTAAVSETTADTTAESLTTAMSSLTTASAVTTGHGTTVSGSETQTTAAESALHTTDSSRTTASRTTAGHTTTAGKTETTVQTTALPDMPVTVPDLVGMKLADAITKYRNQITLVSDYAVYSTQAADTILSQSVSAKETVRRGDEIHVKVSLGALPDDWANETKSFSFGNKYPSTFQEVQDAGYQPELYWTNLTDEPAFIVFGTEKKDDGTVVIYVSNGTEDKMPYMTGMPLDEVIEMYGHTVSITCEYIDSDLPRDTIIRQSVMPDTPIRTDHALYPDAAELTPVTLYLSKGKPGEQPLGYMPQMVGLVVDPYDFENGYGPLTEFLQQEVLLHFQLVDSDLPYGTVLSQSHEPGTLIRKDTVLGLSISNHRD